MDFSIQIRQASPLQEASFAPVRVPDFRFTDNESKDAPDLSSLFLVRLDENRQEIVFDSEKNDDNRFAVPVRFDPDYETEAIHFQPRQGDLVFVVPFSPPNQNYRLFFNFVDSAKNALFSKPNGVIGDGDSFTQTLGNLQIPGIAAPFEYGERMFARKGILISSAQNEKNYYFEEMSDPADFQLIGEIRDIHGVPVYGTATLHDINDDGTMDIIVGKSEDGSLWLYKNMGTDAMPKFATPVALTYTDGEPISVVSYLKDLILPFYREDDTINKNYPRAAAVRVHGASIHAHAVPRWISFGDNEGLLVGVKEQTLFFRWTGDGFEPGEWVIDENGQPLRTGLFIDVADWNNDGCDDLIGGGHIWRIRFFEFTGFQGASPVFKEKHQWKPLPVLPRLAPLWSQGAMFVGTHFGNIFKIDVNFDQTTLSVEHLRHLTMPNAPLGRNMGPIEYVDLNNDGKKDLLFGDISGALHFAKNIGTNRSPMFKAEVQLNDEYGPIKIIGGPDPQMTLDGYSKPTTADLTGDGRLDIICGSGFGRVHFFRNLGTDNDGISRFAKGEILKDNEGNEILSHHMSGVAATDFNGNGGVDLIVGGSGPIHAHPDDDPDSATWVRWYHGIRNATGKIEFKPYISMFSDQDYFITYRPRPCVYRYHDRDVLMFNNLIYFFDKDHPERLDFAGSYPYPQLRNNEAYIPSDIRFAKFADGDPLIIYGSCLSVGRVFREAFGCNKGYLDVNFYMNGNEKQIFRQSDFVPLETDETVNIPVVTGRKLNGIIPFNDFFTSGIAGIAETSPVGEECEISLLIGQTDTELIFDLTCREPKVEKLIAIGRYHGSFLNGVDDALMLKIVLSPNERLERVWLLTSQGLLTKYMGDRIDGTLCGSMLAGTNIPVRSEATIVRNNCHFRFEIPKRKLGIDKSCFCYLARWRKLYTDIENFKTKPPHEQKYKEDIIWKNGWVELEL